ncbi:hypothetical protein FRX31_018073, partial [Thalictrum thalictroides]
YVVGKDPAVVKEVLQRLDLFERIDESISSNPHLQTSTSDDAVVEVDKLSKDAHIFKSEVEAVVSTEE